MQKFNFSRWYFLFLLFLTFTLAACQTNPAAQPASRELPTPTETQPKATALPTATPSPVPSFTATAENPDLIVEKPTATPLPSATPGRRLILMAVGDVMLGRTIGEMIETEGPEAPFLYTAETLRSADITVGNLECPISDRGFTEDKTYAFRAPIAAAESLAWAGFNLVNLANNHSLDYGPEALQDTLAYLAANSIQSVGAGMNETEAYAPVFIEVDGLRVAFLGFVDVHIGRYDYSQWEAGPDKPGVAWAHEERIRASVAAAKAQADVVVVLVHNGYEFMQSVVREQVTVAQLAIDSGASLVIGSHPHVLQRIDRYQDGLIVYSMGNFVFDNFLFPPNYSAILVVELSPQGVESYELIDVVVQLNGVPQIMPYNLDK
jgi:poly-gamma-glutamate capsule biosynthesis protein CapA/YwtB (metallophosphatase superfamily)